MSTNPDLGSKAIGLVHVRKSQTELPYDPQREREIVATPGNQRERKTSKSSPAQDQKRRRGLFCELRIGDIQPVGGRSTIVEMGHHSEELRSRFREVGTGETEAGWRGWRAGQAMRHLYGSRESLGCWMIGAEDVGRSFWSSEKPQERSGYLQSLGLAPADTIPH
ncbi:hypothetical protein BJV77DRAFT_960678 [Russula vinacea]|nr:hypothetical protein BJV77DRAFT_960678 [Russula vinacea]